LVDLPRAAYGVLDQPTRARLFELLERLGHPATTVELAEKLEMHPNGVRNHLEVMREAGLIERRHSRGGRGRPRDEWTISAAAEPGGRAPTAYAELARWLARACPTGRESLEELEEVGRELGREMGRDTDLGSWQDAPDAVTAALTSLGFQPRVTDRHGDGFCCELGNCPYRDAVRENQPAICGLHRGMTAGLVEAIDPELRLSEFTPRDPEEAGCLVVVAAGG
jgi:predicted ArsR family transcriptional regulator